MIIYFKKIVNIILTIFKTFIKIKENNLKIENNIISFLNVYKRDLYKVHIKYNIIKLKKFKTKSLSKTKFFIVKLKNIFILNYFYFKEK